MHRTSTIVPAARAAARTRAGQDHHRNETAELARADSVIAVTQGQRQELAIVLIEKCMGELSEAGQLQGINGGEKKRHVCMHITSKQIELESPGWSGLVKF